MERRGGTEYVTRGELREILSPIFERHREVDAALRFYRLMVPLGLERFLPSILENEAARQALVKASGANWGRIRNWAIVAAAFYGLAPVALIVVEAGRVLGWWR